MRSRASTLSSSLLPPQSFYRERRAVQFCRHLRADTQSDRNAISSNVDATSSSQNAGNQNVANVSQQGQESQSGHLTELYTPNTACSRHPRSFEAGPPCSSLSSITDTEEVTRAIIRRRHSQRTSSKSNFASVHTRRKKSFQSRRYLYLP